MLLVLSGAHGEWLPSTEGRRDRTHVEDGHAVKHRGLAEVGWGGCFLHLVLEGNLLTLRRDPNKLETLRLKFH